MEKGTILVVDDEEDIVELVELNLTREGYRVLGCTTGEKALEIAKLKLPNLIVLDLMLPGMDGLEVCRRLKRSPKTAHIPIVMLTAKAEESDVLVGFALGADDYVTKPFSMKVLLAKVGAILRRTEAREPSDETLSVGGIQLDVGRHEVTVNGARVSATATEFRILRTLMTARGRVLNRAQLIEAALGTGVAVTDRTIDVHITVLRKKLGDAAGWIQTVRGVGYTFREPVSD